MASRAEQKAQARAERVAREQAEAAAKVRRQRWTMAIGVVVIAVVVAVVAIAISSHKGKTVSAAAATDTTSTVAQSTDTRVNSLLAGIPEQSDNVLGKATAPVKIVEYGDLECSVCDDFALSTSVDTSDGTPGSGVEDQIITGLVKTGKAQLIYNSLDTATSNGATPNMFDTQQAAAYAAGMQNKAWYYIELFYNEQGQEGTNYVTDAYLDGIAKQVPGLNYAQWKNDLTSAQLKTQVTQENAAGTKVDDQVNSGEGASTPTVLVEGKKGEQVVSLGIPSYAEVIKAIAAVS
jgi:protein-disulfide isomerase